MTLRGAHLHLDCASGIAGDMTIAALIDLGVPVDVIGDALDAVGAGRGRLTVRRVVKHGIAAVDVQVATDVPLTLVARAGARGHGVVRPSAATHAHHPYAGIRATLEAAALAPATRRRALDMFDRIARAEAKLHGTTVDQVAFHEVGAIDSIVDVVGTAAALAWLDPASVTCASVAMGYGTFTCAHGVLPVPAPAAQAILVECGGVQASGGVARELCTPTGAAILASAVTAWTPPPTGVALATGWGAGDADLADRANVVRVTAIRPSASTSADALWRLEANLDDMNPEWCGPALDAVLAAGAVDAWWTPIVMKKGRPALQLGVLVDDAARDAVVAAVLRTTTTIGLRFDRVERIVAARELVTVETAFGAVVVKVARHGGAIVNLAPEHAACVAVAAASGAALKDVYAAALGAALARFGSLAPA